MQIIENFYTGALLARIKHHSRSQKLIRTNITDWDTSVIGASSPIIVIDITGDLARDVIEETAPYLNDEDWKNCEWGISIHLGSHFSLIPWHNDAHRAHSVTVYLNTAWEPDWAGYFMYEDDWERGRFHAVLPKYNRGLVYETPLMHSVALSTFNAPLRESLQIFLKRK